MPTWNHTQNVDALTMMNHAFVKDLWDKEKGKALRDSFFDPKLDLSGVQGLLNARGFEIPSAVQIIIVDIESAETRKFPDPIIKTVPYYCLVLPPVPTKTPMTSDYKAHQTSVEALFHASNDGYGM